jgi:hypothetical protein
LPGLGKRLTEELVKLDKLGRNYYKARELKFGVRGEIGFFPCGKGEEDCERKSFETGRPLF